MKVSSVKCLSSSSFRRSSLTLPLILSSLTEHTDNHSHGIGSWVGFESHKPVAVGLTNSWTNQSTDIWKKNCYQHSCTCCVQCWPTHQTLARLSVSLASSIQLPMTIRRSFTPTTFSYPCSHSFTNEHSRSRVSRSEGEGEEWVTGLGGC